MNKKLILLFILFYAIQTARCQESKAKIGLVLSGGGAKGLAHIGVLKVIDELNIPVDYVAGTSMGSVIGGMYAMGYSAEEIEQFALSRDWDALFSNDIARKNLSIREKQEQEKYIFSFPASNLFDINLPGGLSTGQNISLMLSNVTWDYHDVSDFSNLPIPYFCNATDLETGKEVILDSGNMATAIRASIAIPTIFTPIEINEKLLVDGGIVNNFPVDEMKRRNVDIIIGVNLGFKSYSKDELNSLGNIIEQALFIHAYEKNLENQKMCDILISPDIQEMSAAGFNNIEQLIAKGELAARKNIEALHSLANDRADNLKTADTLGANKKELITLTNIELTGIENVSQSFVMGKLKLKTPSTVTLDEVEESINRMYGSQFFTKATYQLKTNKSGKTLIINTEEKSKYLYQIGGHYDRDFRSSLLLNTSITNPILKGTKFNFDLVVGEFQNIKAEYLIFTGWKPRKTLLLNEDWKLGLIPDIGFSIHNQILEIPEFEDGRKTAVYDYRKLSLDLVGFSNVSNNFSVGTGVKTDISRISEEVVTDPDFETINNTMLNAYAYYKQDTYDQSYYPTRGNKIHLRAEYATDTDKSSKFQYDNLLRLSLFYDHALSLNDKATFIGDFFTGTVLGQSIPNDYLLYFGGMNKMDFNNIVVPFTGLEFLEVSARNALVAGLNFQYQVFKDQYITWKGNLGKAAHYYENLFSDLNIYYGTGITYGYNSFIGPIEFTIMHGTNKGILYYFNLGYWF